ncbi:MAG: hypothetical protein HKM89_10385, partial [Gemmatimonadales bacterium]|nr:hypothetical protein [Gemmatimonadales bacterium]
MTRSIMDADRPSSRLTFNGLLLTGVILSMAMALGIAVLLYLMPADHLQLPELQPFARVARVAEFPVGASRVVNWGDQI